MAEPRFLDRKVYYPGQTIFKEGEEGNRAYLVQEGAVEIVKTYEDGTTQVLGEVTDGGIFGEMALIDNEPRMAMARAKTQVTVIHVNREAFLHKLQRADPFIRGLLKLFVRNMREIQKERHT